MNISLKNIGIIKDSNIEIKGLTVITGQNNSGKTTVGKVLYSVFDAVSNLQQKAENDRYVYAVKKINDACEEFSFCRIMKRGRDHIKDECLQIFFSDSVDDHVEVRQIANYLSDLIVAVKQFDISEEPYSYIMEKYQRRFMKKSVLEMKQNDGDLFEKEKKIVLEILEKTLNYITRDKDLVDYAKQSINETLSVEFYGQIQPVAINDVESFIEINDEGKKCFAIKLYQNEIVETDEPVYFYTPYKQAFFIDNPFVLDEPAFRKATKYTTANMSYVNESRILTHDNKLKFILNFSQPRTLLEGTIFEERNQKIKEKMNEILPGDFSITEGERYYIQGDIKLKSANMATGAKTFSIIKMLLERGVIDDETILILDEPESHLHPRWQNQLAEIIVLLVKEIGCHILLTTHSSNLMLAVDAYMRKYQIEDLCIFYQTEHLEDGMHVNYRCVNDSLGDIYEDFVKYLSDVKMLRNNFLTDEE